MVEGAEGLSIALTDWGNHRDRVVPQLKGIRDANALTRNEITTGLSDIFIPPLPHEDLAHLNVAVHAVVKATYTPANYLVMYKISEIPAPVVTLGEILLEQTRALASVINELPTSIKNGYDRQLIEVDRLESEADDVKNRALGELISQEPTVVELSLAHRMGHIYDLMEGATDVANHCAITLRDIAVRNLSLTTTLKGPRSK